MSSFMRVVRPIVLCSWLLHESCETQKLAAFLYIASLPKSQEKNFDGVAGFQIGSRSQDLKLVRLFIGDAMGAFLFSFLELKDPRILNQLFSSEEVSLVVASFASNLLFVSVSEVPDLYSNPDLKSGSGLFSVIGIPLHLWTVTNLKRIGGKLGHIDTMELAAGRLLVDVDTRKPLIFTKKIQSPGGDEVSIQFTYDRLFKHCSYCGFLTHEAANCTKKMEDQRQQAKEAGVFSRVQLPFEPQNRQSLLEDRTRRDLYHSHRDRKNDTWKDHEAVKPATAAYSRSSRENRDRVEHDYSERRHERLVERPLRRPGDNRCSNISTDIEVMELGHHDDTYQDRLLKIAEECSGNENAPRGSGKKLASTIVSPYHASNENDVNVTFRSKSSTRAIDFSPMENVTRDIDFSHMENEMHNNDLNKGQIIEALHDMDIGGSSVGAQLHDASMDVDATDDDDVDLLGEELKEMEEPHHIASSSNEKSRIPSARFSKETF
ncbi:hypothetical protein HID58_043576 [Brassica napus]|uniref:Zinc knuckle CX2CX4HX4C domain-containing protein n=1 Tax=Brassica napus TaxID=3708 RepID=A0ABQ8BID5_BRANA|nr:hypothetical protein HID58_043576 [Brassica napus]